MLATMLAHSSGQGNNQLSEAIVTTLGFGWILALCGPGLHSGTVFLGLKILVNVTKYPALLAKFRDGTANGGWLTDADSVIRNRAAVLLGFSVSAHGGAVGSHVDFNPELSNCNGFAALEHLMYAHADKPFCYLAMLALLFGRHQANIQPLEEFTVDLIWSNVFSLNATSSVSDAIAKCTFCPEALIALFSMVRAGFHYNSNETVPPDHWSQNYPIMVIQLTTFWRGGKAEDGIDENTLVTALHTARDLDDSLRAIVAESAPRYGDARPVASIPERNEVVFRGPEPIQPVAAQAAAPLTLESDSGHETNKYHQQRTRKLLYHLLADPRDWYKIRIVSR